MAAAKSPASALKTIDSLVVEVITDDVSDTYVSKTLFAVSEFSNVVLAGAKVISGEALLCANLGFGLKLVSQAENVGIRCCSIPGRKERSSSATAPISEFAWARSNALR